MRNKKKVAEYNRDYYQKNKSKLLPKIRARVDIWQKENMKYLCQKNKQKRKIEIKQLGRTKNSNYSKNYRDNLKKEVIQQLGGKCICCGISEPEFLTIDHVNGGGSKHRNQKGMKGGGSSWRMVKKSNYSPEYQLLCFNCNYSKHLGNGKCIHQRLI